MPAFGILVIRTSERGGATAVKKWNTIRSTSRSSPPLETRGPGPGGQHYEWNRAKPVRCAMPGHANDKSLEALQSDSMEPREKFVWSFFEGTIKTCARPAAAPHRRHRRRHRRYFDLLCAQVAASQAVTHPAGFLRVEKGATMEGARRPERRWLDVVWKATRTAIYAISFEGATRGPSPVNNATLRGRAESSSRSSRWTLTIGPRSCCDRPRSRSLRGIHLESIDVIRYTRIFHIALYSMSRLARRLTEPH